MEFKSAAVHQNNLYKIFKIICILWVFCPLFMCLPGGCILTNLLNFFLIMAFYYKYISMGCEHSHYYSNHDHAPKEEKKVL